MSREQTSKNRNLQKAMRAKYDEFYTQRSDVEAELKHYKRHFKGKVIYCNCDDPNQSAFWQYFANQKQFLGYQKLIATCYKSQDSQLFSKHKSKRGLLRAFTRAKNPDLIATPEEVRVVKLKGDGDFRSAEAFGAIGHCSH